MPYSKLGMPHFKLQVPHSKLRPPHLKLGVPRSKLGPAHSKLREPGPRLQLPWSKLGMAHPSLRTTRPSLRVRHFKLRARHFKLRARHFKLRVPHFKSGPRRSWPRAGAAKSGGGHRSPRPAHSCVGPPRNKQGEPLRAALLMGGPGEQEPAPAAAISSIVLPNVIRAFHGVASIPIWFSRGQPRRRSVTSAWSRRGLPSSIAWRRRQLCKLLRCTPNMGGDEPRASGVAL